MNDTAVMTPTFDRTAEDLGNIVELGHVNVRVPDQSKAVAYLSDGPGPDARSVSDGRPRQHVGQCRPRPVPSADARHRCRARHDGAGDAGPGRAAEAARDGAKKYLEGTKFSFREAGDTVETVCPWGNRIRVHAPDPARFGAMRVGMPYVEFDIPAGTDLAAIAKFYKEILGGIAGVSSDERGAYAWASTSAESKVIYRETTAPIPEYDGHHIQITLADFSGPHKKLLERGLITEESDQHQYRFLDIVDVDTNKPLFRIEHETRSMRHPMFGRTFINRNPDMNNRNFVPGYEVGLWALN